MKVTEDKNSFELNTGLCPFCDKHFRSSRTRVLHTFLCISPLWKRGLRGDFKHSSPHNSRKNLIKKVRKIEDCSPEKGKNPSFG